MINGQVPDLTEKFQTTNMDTTTKTTTIYAGRFILIAEKKLEEQMILNLWRFLAESSLLMSTRTDKESIDFVNLKIVKNA